MSTIHLDGAVVRVAAKAVVAVIEALGRTTAKRPFTRSLSSFCLSEVPPLDAVPAVPGDHCSSVSVKAAATAGYNFRAVTSLSPLQFQKQVRLIEARRMMLSTGQVISNATHAVGYESIQQFTRAYGRIFGLPPARDIKQSKPRMNLAA
ncbi:helix-turn-helix domain-containing protein [Rhizobium leguminosarum bv. viciae]|nr:helix-turn-helix domain-containing protein [Rhizobium leguminosarum bv. viciae]